MFCYIICQAKKKYRITNVMWYFFFLKHKTQPVDLSLLLCAAETGINAGGIKAGMPQQIRKTAQILFHLIVQTRKEVPQIVGEHLFLCHPGSVAKRLHPMEDVAPVQGLAAAGHEDAPGVDATVFCVVCQFPGKGFWNQHLPGFTLERYDGSPLLQRLHRNEAQLTDSYAGSAEGLHQHIEPDIVLRFGSLQKAVILCFSQLPVFPSEDLALDSQSLYHAVIAPDFFKKTISAASIELTLAGAYFSTSCCL